MAEPALKIDREKLKAMLKRHRTDFEYVARKHLRIRDHNTSKLVPLEFNSGQRILHTIAERQKDEQGIVRIIILKARRFGGSTYVEGRFYWLTSKNHNKNAFIVAHEEKSTATLFRMAQLMHEQDPYAPAVKASNAQELRFDTKTGDGLKSEYQLGTAKNVDTGRSQGIHYLHDSEEAFWPDPETLLTGLMQCVPDPPAESEVFRESTANGYGNVFQADVMEAYNEGKNVYYQENDIPYAWKSSSSDWILVFIPWFAHDRYTMDFESAEEKQRFIAKSQEKVFDEERQQWVDSEATKLRKKYRLTWEQLNWRAWAIENKCRGDIDKFHQEYPSTVDEAFLSTGSNVYGKELCDDIEAQCEHPALVGHPVMRYGKVGIKRDKHGPFSMWEKPSKNETYFMTVDCAGGRKKKHENESREPDRTNIDVFNHRTGVQAAQWNGHIAYDLIADLVDLIGTLYNEAPAAVEMNNHGFTVVAMLKERLYPQFEMKPDEPGWLTNARTKSLLVDGLYEAARDGSLQIRSHETVSEMRTFIEENGEYHAETGCKDDRVITAGIASQVSKILPRKWQQLRKTQDRPHTRAVSFTNRSKWSQPTKPERYQEVRV